MPTLTKEERIERANDFITQAQLEWVEMPATGRARTYSVARVRKFLRAAKQVLAALLRKRSGVDPDAQAIIDHIETLWP